MENLIQIVHLDIFLERGERTFFGIQSFDKLDEKVSFV